MCKRLNYFVLNIKSGESRTFFVPCQESTHVAPFLANNPLLYDATTSLYHLIE